MLFWWLFSSPGAPPRDADTLQDVDAKLTDVHEEEHEEPEGAVTPAERENKQDMNNSEGVYYVNISGKWKCSCRLPECSVKRSVPADERTRCEEQEPEDGQAEVNATTWVHTEPGQAAHQVRQQRPRVNWAGRRKKSSKCLSWSHNH